MELNGLARMAGLGERDGHISGAPLDVTVPNVARIYDYLLGGKDNYAADRDAAGQLQAVLPDVAVACRQNREFLRRAVRYLAAEKGISQFIDIGSGLPTACNTHQIAQAARPGSRVVYVDHDPVVVAHSRALLEKSPDVAVVEADLRQPARITADRSLRNLLDLSQPTAFLLVAVLHFIRDSEDPHGIVAMLRSVMAPGSYLVISHVTHDSISREECDGGVSVYEKASAPVIPRRRDEVLRFFDGMHLVSPGVVNVSQWRARGAPVRQLAYGAAGCSTLGGSIDHRLVPFKRTSPAPARPRRPLSDETARPLLPGDDANPEPSGVSDAEILTWAGDRSARLQIAARLARQIRDGSYPDWAQLPSGTALARQYDVSARTVNRAQRLLADRGLIRRAGSFYYVVTAPADGQVPAPGLTTGDRPRSGDRDRDERRRAGGPR